MNWIKEIKANWVYSIEDPLIETLAACVIIFVLIIVITRIVGLRSFAKFTAYDFAFTIAIGSILSSVLISSTTITHGFVAIIGLLSLSYIFSVLQKKFEIVNKLISNKPLLLMDGPEILTANLKSARIHEEQLLNKLREANVLSFKQVVAVVLESTGDISVLHRPFDASQDKFNDELLKGVTDNK